MRERLPIDEPLVLEVTRHDPNAHVRHRAQCLVVLARASSLRAASRLTGVDPKTLRRWQDRFAAEGRDGLADRLRSGRRPKLDAAGRARLTAILDEMPTAHGYATATWTLADMRDLLAREGWVVGTTTVGRTLHALGYAYRRPRHDLQHRQDADAVATAKQTLALLQKKGGLTEEESAWCTAMNATFTPTRTWHTSGNAAGNVYASRPLASTNG